MGINWNFDGFMSFGHLPKRVPLTGFAEHIQAERAFAIRADEYQEQQDEARFNEILDRDCRLVLDVACALVQISELQSSYPSTRRSRP